MSTLLASCVLIPGIGFLLVKIFPLTPDASVGILLLAAIPGTAIALQFTRMAVKPLALAAVMTFVLSLVRHRVNNIGCPPTNRLVNEIC
jgi:predicted Na+-dependent transporter